MRTYKAEGIGLMALLGLLALLAYASGAYAGPGDGRRGDAGGPGFGFLDRGFMLDRMTERLDLDDEQRQALQNILDAARPEVDALREATRKNHDALAALDPASAGYSAELNDIAAENGRLATEGTLLFARVRTEINAVLTDEQRAQLSQGRERMRDNMERRAGKRQEQTP